MQISRTGDATRLTLSSSTAAVRAWQVGQVLEATVLSSQTGRATLRIGSAEVQASTAMPLVPGQRLQLQVTRAGAQPVLRILPPESDNDLIAAALRTVLPRHGPMAPLFAALAALGQAAAGSTNALYTQAPTREQLADPQQLRQALQNSGTFLESRLAAAAPDIHDPCFAADLKAVLLAMRENEDAPALRRHAESALARIEFNQLQHLIAESAGRQVWCMTLPVRQGAEHHVLDVRIEREGESGHEDPDAQAVWSLSLDFDLPGLGRGWARVSVCGKAVTVGLSAERQETASYFSGALETLHASLVGAGLEVHDIACMHGIVPMGQERLATSLIDERA